MHRSPASIISSERVRRVATVCQNLCDKGEDRLLFFRSQTSGILFVLLLASPFIKLLAIAYPEWWRKGDGYRFRHLEV